MNDKPELFRLCITRIQMEKLPVAIHIALNEARMKKRSTDTMVDLTQTLLGALNRNVGMKPPKGSAAKLEANRQDFQPQGATAYPVFLPQLTMPPPPVTNQPQTQNGARPRNNQNKNKNQGQQQNQGQRNRDRSSNRGRNSREDKKKNPKSGGGRKSNFVTPWPENKTYLSKNGNQLSNAFNDHFRDFCFRCGHSSHQGKDCPIYTNRTPIMSLCTHCRQGLHDDCKSRRRDLVEPADKGMAVMKQILQAQAMLLRG